MNTNPVQNQPDARGIHNGTSSTSAQVQPASSSFGAEHEKIPVAPPESIREASQEIEIPEEVERAGVKPVSGTIELPPDMKKLGITPAQQQSPQSQKSSLPQVILPISDDLVASGLHAHMSNALKWLAVWCVRRLSRAHILLKNMHGKIIRVKG